MNINELGMCFELEDIEDIEYAGYKNCYDICVEGNHSFLLSNGIISHNSALGGLMPVLGRKDIGYYTLKGKPLNAYSQPHKKFLENAELTGLYQVLNNGITEELKEDGRFFEIELNGEKVIVNENDEVQIDGKWVCVKTLI